MYTTYTSCWTSISLSISYSPTGQWVTGRERDEEREGGKAWRERGKGKYNDWRILRYTSVSHPVFHFPLLIPSPYPPCQPSPAVFKACLNIYIFSLLLYLITSSYHYVILTTAHMLSKIGTRTYNFSLLVERCTSCSQIQWKSRSSRWMDISYCWRTV